jgi:nucleoside-diphosphate kinase
MEKTLLIIKPDGVQRKLIGKIIERIEGDGFDILNMRWLRMNRNEAGEFYAVHKGKPFYNDLVAYITSGPTVALLLQKENGQRRLREIVGATDPKKASPGTIRADFGSSIQNNTVHASDPAEDPSREMKLIFG